MENKEKYTRNSRYQHFTEAMWEIENNPDILSLDKDPEAEHFLCNMFQTEKPMLNAVEPNDEQIDKVIDVENAELNDVEGIMNLEECEWNEIFPVEDHDTHVNTSDSSQLIVPDLLPIVNNFLSCEKTSTNLETTPLLETKPLPNFNNSTPCYTNELLLSALHSNCKVILKKLSLDDINKIIQSNKSSKKNRIPNNHNSSDIKIENKLKKAINGEKISKKLQGLSSDHKKSTSHPTKSMSTINKNSVSRIIDAITIDSDDNQSCIIISSVNDNANNKGKSDKTGVSLKVEKNKSKLMPGSLSKFISKNESSDKSVINFTSKSFTSKCNKSLKLKNDKANKKDWIVKNVKETPMTFENLFNKKFSILGSGMKISKKTFSNRENSKKLESNSNENKWEDASIKSGDHVRKAPLAATFNHNTANSDGDDDCLWPKEKNNDDDDDDNDCQWPKEKDDNDDDDDDSHWPKEKNDYDDFKNVNAATKDDMNDVDLQWPKVRNQCDDSNKANIKRDYNCNDGEDNDEDCQWPEEKNSDNDFTETDQNKLEENIVAEIKETTENFYDLDDNELGLAQKWYGDDGDSGDETMTKAKNVDNKTDPWSSYLSKKHVKVKKEFSEDLKNVSKSNEIIEIEDDSDNFDVIVKDESCNQAAPMKSYGNVWSHIKEFQNQFEIQNKDNNMDVNDVDETLKTMNYIKDAKWLNSRNEDFLDSYNSKNDYCPNTDSRHSEHLGKWYKNDKANDYSSECLVPKLKNNRNQSSEYKANQSICSESWVDNGPFKTYKTPFNKLPSHQQSGTVSKSKFISPNSKPSPFQDITMEQLFPPFKEEYFTNTRTSKSTDISKNWHGKMAASNNILPISGFPQIVSKSLDGLDEFRDGEKPRVKVKPLPHGHLQYYNDSNRSYHKESPFNGISVNDSFNVYRNSFSKVNNYPCFPNNSIPISPESPDPYSEDLEMSNKNAKTPDCHPTTLPQSNHDRFLHETTGGNNNVQSSNPLFHPQSDQELYQQYNMNPYCYNPCYGSTYPYFNYYSNHHQYYSHLWSNEPVSFTPASPDPEEMCQQDDSHQTSRSNV